MSETKREYLRVVPTSEELQTADIPTALESLYKLTNPTHHSLSSRLNPFVDTSPPTFEFLAVSEGTDEPVEFYYGADQPAHLETLEKRLKTIYPTTFDITRSELELEEKLTRSVDKLSGDQPTDFGRTDGGQPIVKTDGTEQRNDDERTADETTVLESSSRPTIDETSVEDKPVETDDETVSDNRFGEDLETIGVQWHGRGKRKRDWMTTLKSFANRDPDPTEYDTEQPPLATVIDHLTEIEYPIVFQVIWQRRPDWSADAEVRKEDLREGRDTFAQRYIAPVFEIGTVGSEPRDEEPKLSSETRARIDRIDAKHPKRTFTANARAIAVAPEETENREQVERHLDQLAQSLTPLDGPFYGLEGKRLRELGLLSRTKQKRVQALLEKVLEAEFVTGRGKSRPELVLNGDELANLVVVPSGNDLTIEGSRGARSEQRSRNPLPRPNPDLMDEFREGMAIGYALDETGEPEDEPVRIPPSLLPTHYVRAATTGGGKSKALTNDKLSLYEQTDGPIILIDAKGDGLCGEYMRAHARQFGMDDLEENVLHFPVPEVLPGFAFFNLEPAVENGVRRVDAVQNKADHYEEILKRVMGEERYERAVVAPNLIKYLIKTLYDEEHGRENGRYRESVNYFAHDQLEHIVDQLWRAGPPDPEDGAAPKTSDPQVQRQLERQLQLDPNNFATVMGGVSNRIDYISQDEHLRRIFNNTDPQFDFRDLLDERKVILFDLSSLRDDSAKAMTGVILTELYNALRERGDEIQSKPDDYVVNLLIDEASSLAVSDVMNDLLEKGRSFRLSVGLSLQFPEQLDVKGGRETYLNVLNDVGSPIIGKIAVDDEIASVMAHEDMDPDEFANRIRSLPRGEWIVRLPSPKFGETGPEPFSLSPLPIPPGHSESDDPLTDRKEQQFQDVLERIHERASTEYGVVSGSLPSSQTSESVQDAFDLESADLDEALAHAVRTVQLQHGVRDENGWVPVQPVDETLRSRYEAVDASPPSIEELGEIRERSRLLEVTLEQDSSEIVARLTETGEEMTELETGDVRAAGNETHDELLATVERTLSQYDFDVTIFTQDGSEKPDGRAIHPDCEHIFEIEVESTTIDKPVKILRNFQRAHEAGHIPFFVVSDSGTTDGVQTASRLERIISSPVKELESGETRLYTTDSHITFDGGASARDGVTAVRPLVGNSRRSVWIDRDDEYVLHDGEGNEFSTVSSFDSLSRSDVPAVYSYNRATDEYVVNEHTDRHTYESRSAFESEWVPIKRPFIPESSFAQSQANLETYVIAVINRETGSIHLYRNGERVPLEEFVDELASLSTDPDTIVESDIFSSGSEPESEQSDSSPEQSETAVSESEEADFATFVERCVVERDEAEISKNDLYDAYQVWADEHDHDAYAKSWFGRKLSEHVSYEEYRPTRDGERVRHYRGITLSNHGKKFRR